MILKDPIHIALEDIILNDICSENAIPIISGVTVNFYRESITAVIGPSGSGKSTLLRLMNGLIEPDSGSISLDGVLYSEIPPRILRRRVGMVFQEPTLFPGSVASNLLFPLQISGQKSTEWEDLARYGLEQVNLKSVRFWDRDVAELSLGEKHRIALVRTLLTNPEVLLLDEPTASLDPGNASFIVDIVKGLNCDRHLTVVWVTHTLDIARRVADHVVMLKKGSLIEEGKAEAVFNNPCHPETKRFLSGEII